MQEKLLLDSEVIPRLNAIYAPDISSGGYTAIQEIQALIEELHLVKIHAQMITNNHGEGVLLMGDAGVGKSRLSYELLQRFPKFRFVADDFPLVLSVNGALYGGYDPSRIRSHEAITFNNSLSDKMADKVSVAVNPEQRADSFVQINKVFFLAEDDKVSDIVVQEMDGKSLNDLLRKSSSDLGSKSLSVVASDSTHLTVLRLPKNKEDRFNSIIRHMEMDE